MNFTKQTNLKENRSECRFMRTVPYDDTALSIKRCYGRFSASSKFKRKLFIVPFEASGAVHPVLPRAKTVLWAILLELNRVATGDSGVPIDENEYGLLSDRRPYRSC